MWCVPHIYSVSTYDIRRIHSFHHKIPRPTRTLNPFCRSLCECRICWCCVYWGMLLPRQTIFPASWTAFIYYHLYKCVLCPFLHARFRFNIDQQSQIFPLAHENLGVQFFLCTGFLFAFFYEFSVQKLFFSLYIINLLRINKTRFAHYQRIQVNIEILPTVLL